MLHYASFGNPPKKRAWLWAICFISLGVFIYWGMQKTIEWSDQQHNKEFEQLAK